MESLEMLDDGGRVLESGVYSFDDEAEQMDSFSENLGVAILEGFDSYMEDINERLIISRMVSDSVIKGIVNAVEEESAEKIASKDLELANLKDLLNQFRVKDSLLSLKNAACHEFIKLKREICSVRRFVSELVGSSKANGNISWDCVDKTLENLESVVQTICSSENSIEEMNFQRQVEDMVIESSIRSIQEEFEAKFWDENKSFCGYKRVNWLEKFKEIFCLRKELDTVLKLLPNQETSHLISHGSYDFDHSISPSLHESNGDSGSKTRIHDKYDAAKFSHMTNKELVIFFNTTIIELKREHESIVQEKTEQYYDLKKKYLNERGSSLPLKKDKGSDVLRIKIPEVIIKLDNLLEESKKDLVASDDFESISTLKSKLDNLLSENHRLRDLITEKKNEVQCLALQISEHSLHEVYLEKLVENLQLDIEDAKAEASVREDLYKCVLKELTESQNEGKFGQESKRFGEYDEILDLGMENLIMQGIYEVIYKEKVKELLKEVLIANASGVEIEKELSEMKHEFQFILQEKEKSSDSLLAELKSVNVQLECSCQELHKLRDEVNLQQNLISERSEELNVVKSKLSDAIDQENVHKMELNGLKEKIKLAIEDLKNADNEKKILLALSSEKDNALLQFNAQKNEQLKEIESLVVLVNDFSEKILRFESEVNQDIEDHNSRLENSQNELNYVLKKVSDVVQTEALYKQKLEKRCTDLKIAEEEVDLLGDEVETLLSLLEKIYIALDHYSPILKHYPGIIEILKLVRKELSGERAKSF